MNEMLWHKCRNPLLPKRDINGKWLVFIGQIWRRRRADGRWEYRQEKESYEKWAERQW